MNKKRFSIKKIILLIFVMFLSFSIFSAQASWLIKEYLTTEKELVDQNTNGYHNVYIKYVSTETITTQPEIISTTTINSSSESDYNKYKSYTLNQIVTSNITQTTTTEGDVVTVTYSYTETKITKCTNGIFGFGRKVEGTINSMQYKSITSRNIDNTVQKTYQVKNNELFIKPNITREGYKFMGYLNASDDGNTVINTIFDFNKPITKTTYLFMEWVQSSSSSPQLTEYINSLSSGSSNIYPGSSATWNLNNDEAYNPLIGYGELGSKSLATTIKSGVTVNFALASGKTNQEATEGAPITDVAASTASADKFISLDYVNEAGKVNTKDYEIVLQNDLIINGTMVLGGMTGATTAGALGPQGHIMSNYVKIDLNGHNIYIKNGGVLHSFGYIDDSVGTGKIIVEPNGTLKTQMVVYAIKGGNHTLWGYSKGIAPFEHYVLPYINCEVNILSTTSASGCLDIFTKFNLGSLGFTNMYIRVFGKNSATAEIDKYFIETVSKSNDGGIITIKPKISKKMLQENTSNVINKNMVYYRNQMTFNNINASINGVGCDARVFLSAMGMTIDKDFKLSLDRMSFPISPSWDLDFINSNFKLSQKLIFMPGSSLSMDKDCVLNFDYYRGSGTTAIAKSFESVSVLTKSLPGVDKYISGGLFVMNENVVNVQQLADSSLYGLYAADYNNYWRYYKESSINIFGRINFASGNYEEYKLAGNININTYSIDNGTVNKWNIDNISNLSAINLQTYDLELIAVNFVWFTEVVGSGDNDETCSINRFYGLPLISNGEAYIVDSSNNLVGSWDNANSIFEDNSGNTYFFKTNNQLLVTPSDKRSQLDYSITPTECTITENHSVIDSAGIEYVYYAGYMVPVTSRTDATTVVANVAKLSNKSTALGDVTLKYSTVSYNGTTYNTWVRQV